MANGWEVDTSPQAPAAAPPAGGGGGAWEVDTGAPAPTTTTPPATTGEPPTEDHLDDWLSSHPGGQFFSAPVHLLSGIGAGLDETLAGADTLVRKVTGGKLSAAEEALQRAGSEPTHGTMEKVGKGLEGVGEFFTGEELLGMLGRTGTVMRAGDKLKSATQLASVLNKHPYIAKALKIGLDTVKAGTMGGAQEYVKTGGDTDAALKSGLLTGGGTALLGGTGLAAKGLLDLAPGEKTVEGVAVPYLKSQINKAGKFIEGGDISELAPKIAADQQAAAQQIIRNTASRAVGKVLDMVNNSRQFFSRLSPEAAESVPQSTSPFKFELSPKVAEAATPEEAAASEAQSAADQKTLDALGDKRASGEKLTPAEQQQWQMAWDRESGQMRTTPSLAQATRIHQDLNDLYMSDDFDNLSAKDQNDVNEIRQRLSDQIGMHHASSRFDPINTADLVANTHTFGHAAAQLESTVQPVIQAMDRASKGTIGAAQRGVEEASAALRNARTADAFKDATKVLSDRQQNLTELLNRYSSAVSGADYDAVQKAMPYVRQFQTLHNTFEHMMNGVTFDEATESGLSRVMTGSARNFQTWLDNPANAKMLDDTIGKASRTNLKELTLLMSKVQPQRHLAEGLKDINAILDKLPSGHMGGYTRLGVLGVLMHGMGIPGGAIAAIGGGAVGARFIMRQAATNPKIGQAITYAVNNGIRPDVYAPYIARMIAEPMRDEGQLYEPGAPGQEEQQPQPAGATQ